jgi:hypothetical protein
VPSFADVVLNDVSLTPQTLTDFYSVFPAQPFPLDQSSSRVPADDLRPAYTISWNAMFEREIAVRFVTGFSYLGAKWQSIVFKEQRQSFWQRGLAEFDLRHYPVRI